jgi:hypothetical protein
MGVVGGQGTCSHETGTVEDHEEAGNQGTCSHETGTVLQRLGESCSLEDHEEAGDCDQVICSHETDITAEKGGCGGWRSRNLLPRNT